MRQQPINFQIFLIVLFCIIISRVEEPLFLVYGL